MLGVYKGGSQKMRPRLVTNCVCVGVCWPVIIIACLVIRGCIFGFLVIVRVKGISFFYCQLYFSVRFFSCVVFVFWFTFWFDIYDSKACLTCKMQIFN